MWRSVISFLRHYVETVLSLIATSLAPFAEVEGKSQDSPRQEHKRLAARRRRKMRHLLLQPLQRPSQQQRAIRFAAREAKRAEVEAARKKRKERRRSAMNQRDLWLWSF